MLVFKNTTKVNITKSKSNEYKDKEKDTQGKKIFFIVHTNYLAFNKLWCSALYEFLSSFMWKVTVSRELMFLENYGNFDVTNTVALLL